MKYKRITNQEWSDNIDLTQELGYSYIYKRLYELENRIEQGTLKEIHENATVVVVSDKKINRMAEIIDDIDNNAHIYETRWDGCVAIANSEIIAKELLKYYQPKLPEDSVVFSNEEQAIRVNELIETLKAVKNQAGNEAVEKFAKELLDTKIKILNDYFIYASNVKTIAKQLGIEIKEYI